MTFAFAASKALRIRSGDIKNAYFQGEKLTMILLFRQPRGGLPDENVKPDDYLLAHVPIYGTKDAGRGFNPRGFWKRVRKVALEAGLKENHAVEALYTWTDEPGTAKLMLATHVDDVLWACTPDAEHIIEQFRSQFEWGSEEVGTFRYCGKNIVQKEDFSITVNCE